jgi:hypothetical protein
MLWNKRAVLARDFLVISTSRGNRIGGGTSGGFCGDGKEGRVGLPMNRLRLRRPRPRKAVSPSTPEVPSIGALGYFGIADLTRRQSRGRGRRRERGRLRWVPAIRHMLLAIRALPRSVVQAYRPINVGIALRRIEEKLDTAAGLLPLITHYGLHDVPLRFLIPGQHRRRAVLGFKFLPGAI